MQNRYVGDVADFGKHGLLRFLSGMTDPTVLEPDLRLGLVWYMFPDECGNQHGGITGYLRPTEKNDRSSYRDCDPPLWELPREFVDKGVRCVHCVQKNSPLPGDTLYYGAPLHFPPYMLQPIRKNVRDLWLAGALQATEGASLVMVDPDNGVASPQKMYRQHGPKFTYLSDLREFWERKQSLVVYHHLGMTEPAEEQIKKLVATVGDGLEDARACPIPLRFRRGTARVFLVVPHPESPCGDVVRERANRLVEGLWGANGHFERFCTKAPEIGGQEN